MVQHHNIVDWPRVYVLHKEKQIYGIKLAIFSAHYGCAVAYLPIQHGFHYDLFQPLSCELIIGQCLRIQHLLPLKPVQLKAVHFVYGYYMNELLCQLLPETYETSSSQLFESYEAVLQSPTQLEYLRYFELDLLTELGILPSFQEDIHQQTILPNADYHYTDEGFVKGSNSCSSQDLISGYVLNKIVNRMGLLEEELSVLKQITRKLIAKQLTNHGLSNLQQLRHYFLK